MTDQPGATGRFPEEPMGPHDHGQIAVGLRIVFLHGEPRLVIDFGPKAIKWFSMTPDQADAFAAEIKERAATMRRTKQS
jgi:hypothetical protein